jgi:FtsH-binding integral membrane protein
MISLASAYACFFLPNFVEAADTLLFVGGIISFFSFKVAQQIRPTFYEEKINEGMIYRTKNDWDRLAIYGMGCIGMGIATSPIFLAISGAGGAIIPMTMGVTAAIFGGASLVGLYLPKNTLLGYRSALKGSLIGLIGLNATGLLAAQIFGISLFASTLTSFESYMGIGLFSLMLIYDTTVAISRYEKGDADHLGMSIHVLLNVLNLIVRIAI